MTTLVVHRVGRNAIARERFDAIMQCGELRPYDLLNMPHPISVGMRPLDLLAGDGARVFLAPLSQFDDAFYGFGFDLNVLLRHGARVRECDLLPAYSTIFRHLTAGVVTPEDLYKNRARRESLCAAFLSRAQQAQRKAESKRLTLKPENEIVIDGAVPIEWARVIYQPS